MTDQRGAASEPLARSRVRGTLAEPSASVESMTHALHRHPRREAGTVPRYAFLCTPERTTDEKVTFSQKDIAAVEPAMCT
jgi:hypothetical protein